MLLQELPGKPADFTVSAGEWATVWTFTPKTERAKAFISENVEIEDWQWVGESFAVDHRPARELGRYLTEEGFNVFHPNYGYFASR